MSSTATDAWAARFPRVADEAGHYESFYLKACHRTEPKAVWIRYTVHKAPQARPTGSVWFTYFDLGSQPLARKTTLPDPQSGSGAYISIGESSFGPGHAAGSAEDVKWDLQTHELAEPLLHLPKAWMYTAPIPRTKSMSPAPEAAFWGSLTMPGTRVEIDDWRGMWGHNWGAEHAERWIWAHAIFEPGTWLDVVMGRIRVAGWTTPWIANGVVSLDGRRHRVGGVSKPRSTRVRETVEACEFSLPGEVPVTGVVHRSREQTVGWPYSDPSGGSHHSLNCSIAAMSLDCGGRKLSTDHGAVYELGVREADHGITLLPYSDP